MADATETHENTLFGQVRDLCLQSESTDALVILNQLMALPDCRMHGPEHHLLVGAALLSAYRNAGGTIDLPQALDTLQARAGIVPGATCAYWGACGAALSAGTYLGIITGCGPLSQEIWGTNLSVTADALKAIASVGGPRCCKRDSYFATINAARHTREALGVPVSAEPTPCTRSQLNKQCLGGTCPFFAGNV